jgi:hypothetical protein
MTHGITGTVVLHKSANRDCLCCDGPHVFSQYLELDHYASQFPAHFRRDIDHWLQSVLDFKTFEGKTIAITARVVA